MKNIAIIAALFVTAGALAGIKTDKTMIGDVALSDAGGELAVASGTNGTTTVVTLDYLTNVVVVTNALFEVPGTAAQYVWTPGTNGVLSHAAGVDKGYTITLVGDQGVSVPAGWVDILDSANNWTPTGTNVISVWPYLGTNWQYVIVGSN